jgi:hypothetical protein
LYLIWRKNQLPHQKNQNKSTAAFSEFV